LYACSRKKPVLLPRSIERAWSNAFKGHQYTLYGSVRLYYLARIDADSSYADLRELVSNGKFFE